MEAIEKVRTALWNDYEKANETIECFDVKDEGYKEVLEERDKIRNELIKVEQITSDSNGKLLQNKFDSKRDIIRNAISIGTFVISTGVSLYLANKTFKFDQTATVTSTLGRGILNGVLPKMSKK